MKTTTLWAQAIVMILPFLVTSARDTQTAQPDSVANPPFKSFSVTQYATTNGPGPQNILRLDNNGEIVLAARRGITREALKAEVSFTESQIAILETFRLLDERNDTLKTAFMIFGPEETRNLRRRVHAAAPRLSERLEADARAFVNELRTLGREDNAYTMLFSYVLDGLVWGEFEKRSLVGTREITAEHPLWAGEVWALHPPRAFACGTNSISEEGVSLKVNWTEATIPHMRPFVADFPTLIQMFNDYRAVGVVEHRRVREVFGPFDLFNDKGQFTIPILVEDDSNSLYRSAKAIAQAVAADAPEILNVKAMVKDFGFRDEEQALVVTYHELMWEVMNRFEVQGVVHKPVAFAEPDRTESSDIADLVFIVRRTR